MKTIKIMTLHERLITILVFVAMVSLTSCARKVLFQQSSIVPAASGKVTMKKDNNNNYALTVRVNHLASPESLNPQKEFYVVWLETEDHGIKNIGQLVSSNGLFSKKLKASLEVVTPFEPRRVFITAEDEPTLQYPGPHVVLRSRSF